jgi:hypothetical protein
MLLITLIFYLICETGLMIAICKHVYTVYIGVSMAGNYYPTAVVLLQSKFGTRATMQTSNMKKCLLPITFSSSCLLTLFIRIQIISHLFRV